jgi:hypothetical protein
MELKIQTEIGELTGVFAQDPIDVLHCSYTAWFKEKPEVIVEANSINEAINELHISLKIILDYEKENNI